MHVSAFFSLVTICLIASNESRREERIYIVFTHEQMHFLLNLEKFNLHENTHNYPSYMLRSSTILRELVQSMAKVTLLLKQSVKLCYFILCGDVAACRETACVLFVVQNAIYTTNSTHAISRHIATSPQIYDDVILLNVLTEV